MKKKKLKKISEVNPKLEKFLRDNSVQDGDRIIFREQDSVTLAANITLFLKNSGLNKK